MKTQKNFTLIELLVVIGIIAILASMLLLIRLIISLHCDRFMLYYF